MTVFWNWALIVLAALNLPYLTWQVIGLDVSVLLRVSLSGCVVACCVGLINRRWAAIEAHRREEQLKHWIDSGMIGEMPR